MTQPTRTNLDDVTPTLEPVELLMLLLAIAGGTLAAAVFLPTWLPGLTESLLGSEPKAYWYLARAAGTVAYIVLWLSLALGLIITNKMARLWNGGPAVVDLHQFTTWLALALTLFHALILLGDSYIQSTPIQVLVPFSYASYQPAWVGIGQLGFYLAIIVAVSFYFRKQMTYQWWRRLHYASFVVYLMVTVHGVFAGTDTAGLMNLYLFTGLAVYFLTLYRILQSLKTAAPAPAAHRAPPAASGVTRAAPNKAAPPRPNAD